MHPDQVTEKAPSGCYVSGLYLEGAKWDLKRGCLMKSLPKVLTEELPILRVIPIEAHRLKLVVSLATISSRCHSITAVLVVSEYIPNPSLHHLRAAQCYGGGARV